jgi:hypothetical protein
MEEELLAMTARLDPGQVQVAAPDELWEEQFSCSIVLTSTSGSRSTKNGSPQCVFKW